MELPHFVHLTDVNNTHIEKNVIFAEHGLGAEKFKDVWKLIPHNGDIIIGDEVTILDSAIIMRGTIGSTIIGKGSILGVRSHIGHNVFISRGCLIGSGSLIGGSVKIGKNCYIGAGAIIKNKVNIGDNCIIGMGAIVTKDVPNNKTVKGNPAK